jgi:hypothetical protein
MIQPEFVKRSARPRSASHAKLAMASSRRPYSSAGGGKWGRFDHYKKITPIETGILPRDVAKCQGPSESHGRVMRYSNSRRSRDMNTWWWTSKVILRALCGKWREMVKAMKKS